MAVEDTLRIYDDAIVNWIGSIEARSNTTQSLTRIQTVMSTPDRPFGTSPDGSPYSEDQYRAVLMRNPVVSVTRGDLRIDPRHHSSERWLVHQDSSSNTRTPFVQSKYPRPFRIIYSCDLRTRLRSVANSWSAWFYFTFNPITRILINFGLPWGQKYCDVELISIVDNSDLEAGEGEQFKRITASIELLAFMFISVDSLVTDVPDPYGQLTRIPDVRLIQTNVYVTEESVVYPPTPNEPGVVEDATFYTRALVALTNLNIESN